jgi:hypothetical protein
MYSVYQPWDPLKVCVVGRSYPPEFYSWIKVSHVRNLFEKIAVETEEDFQNMIKKLESFGVKVLRPDLPEVNFIDGKFITPPMVPRDVTVMIGNKFFNNYNPYSFDHFYYNHKQPGWPECETEKDLEVLPDHIRSNCIEAWNKYNHNAKSRNCYDKIFDHVRQQGNTVVNDFIHGIYGACVSRIGKDLYFGTETYDQDIDKKLQDLNTLFPEYRNHVVNTGGHSDGVYCPVCPGLIISLKDVPTYADTFPGWEVVYLPNQSWAKVEPFLRLKNKNRGKWWIPGFEHDQSVIDVVETWLDHWTGYVEETVFDVNMLVIDPKNVMVFNYNKQVFDALDRYGITPHVVPLRHRYFWDGGIHCMTSDLHREGVMKDYFSNRS